jgi:nitroreductase
MISELVKQNRSYRRFDELQRVSIEQARSWVDLARYCASGSNLQPLKYFISVEEPTNAKIFPCLAWAGYLKEWNGPSEGERPTAYIVILGDQGVSKNFGVDHGIAAQTILLNATEDGFGGCMIANIKRDALREALSLDETLDILLVLAIGKPVETVKITEVAKDGSIKYWRDANATHYVPKRSLDEVLLNQRT